MPEGNIDSFVSEGLMCSMVRFIQTCALNGFSNEKSGRNDPVYNLGQKSQHVREAK